MAQQASRRTTREVRQLFGQAYDRAAGLVESLQPCGCDGGAHAQDGQDLNAAVQDLLPVRQQAGGCPCGPPCDGTSVDNPSDEVLQETLARLQWEAVVIGGDLASCGCVEEPEVVESPSPVPVPPPAPVRVPPTLMTLPEEIRREIWWNILRPERGDASFVRVVQRYIDPGEDGGASRFRRPLFMLNRGGEPPRRLTFRLQNVLDNRLTASGGARVNRDSRWELLRVNTQVHIEAEDEYWYRALRGGMMLSFTPDHAVEGQVYYGILSAYTFLNTYRGRYLQHIRRVQLNLNLPTMNDYERGAGVQALILRRWWGGTTNGREYLNPLLDLMAGHLPNLQHLSLTFGGWVPDMRREPWREGPPRANTPGQSSEVWVSRLQQSIRGLTRLRLRVMIAPSNVHFLTTDALREDNGDIQRAMHFISTLRGSMLINGDRLGTWHIRSWQDSRPNYGTIIVVHCDDSWDEESGQHVHHDPDNADYDRESS